MKNIITSVIYKIKRLINNYKAKRNTKKFSESIDIDYRLNKKIAEDYRYYESVGINQYNSTEVDGFELWKMDKDRLVTSLNHCYRTLQHVHNKYLKACKEVSDQKITILEIEYRMSNNDMDWHRKYIHSHRNTGHDEK